VTANKINTFIQSHPSGTIFQSEEMLQVYRGSNKHEPVLVTLEDNGEVNGVLLAVIQKEHSGLAGKFSSRSIIFGGPIVKDNDPRLLDKILKLYIKKVESKAIYSQFRNLWKPTEEENKVFLDNGFIYDDHLDILVDLSKNEETLWAEVNPKGKNKIKGAIKSGLVFEVKHDLASLAACYEILQAVYKRAKLPLFGYDFFTSLYKVSTPQSGLRLFTAVDQGTIVGCRLGLVYKNTIYDFYAGALESHYKKHPNDFIPWEIFKWGKQNGYTLFDFGGAGKPGKEYGVRDYKLKFGGELVNHGRYELIHKPLLMNLGKILLKVYKAIR
jgi:serine/alanine adding enzyme